MHSAISDSLDDDGFLFQLYLPEGDAVSVFDRADALAGWVNHFLLGLGVSQPKLDKVKDETGKRLTICVILPSWATTKTKIRKSWRCLWRRLSSMSALPHCCATTPLRVSSQPHRKSANRHYTN